MFHSERLRQEALEKAGNCSLKWTVLRSLQQVYGSTEDTDEIWESAKEEAMEKVRDEVEVKRSF
jgi:hypothetical protein